jgi:redox-sensing transcriptional repressor
LQNLLREGTETISSTQLGKLLGFSDAQVRKDLTYFGQFGYPGIGYRCEELILEIKKILGTDRQWPVVLVGVGNLGRALLGYKGFGNQGFQFVAAFDLEPEKIGQAIDGIPVYGLERLEETIAQNGIKLAVLAVPGGSAQTMADRLVRAGIEGLLNFAPVTLSLPSKVRVVGVDLAIELEQLSFAVVKSDDKS